LKDKRLILEAGCGTGDCTLRVINPDLELVAFDFSRAMVDLARKKLRSVKLKNAHLVLAAATHLPFRHGAFEVVFSRSALVNYVEDPKRFLSECVRVTQPRGRIGFDFISGRPGGVAKRIPLSEVEKLLSSTGLTERTLAPMGFLLKIGNDVERSNFLKSSIETFAQIELLLAQCIKLECSAMTFVIAEVPWEKKEKSAY
jgi:ubiquinone/menaquinone biosynthesis C-methylase UbiE